MLSSSARASRDRAPAFVRCDDVAARAPIRRLTGTTWPVTSQSNRCDRGDRCLTEGAASSRVAASIHVATCTGWTAAIDGTPTLAHQPGIHRQRGGRPARMRVADVAAKNSRSVSSALAGGGDEHGTREALIVRAASDVLMVIQLWNRVNSSLQKARTRVTKIRDRDHLAPSTFT